jgi:lysophospholipase L1-like esterase
MKNLYLITLLLAVSWSCKNTYPGISDSGFRPDYPLNRFESTIRDYERRDSLNFPGMENVVFGGSSSIFFWKTLSKDMLPITAINYGFGGSTFPEVNFYAARTILKNKPKAIVIYCENDLFGKQPKTPTQVLADYQQLVQTIRHTLPKTQLYFVALKPSPSRWHRWAESESANRLIKAFIGTQKRHTYIDIVPCMLKNGRPDPIIFTADSLHMNAIGYARWSEVMLPVLLKN